uniref:Macaca fascicularis brain cDNA clone: QtrA-18875, similar to human myosin VIIA and Rab interacting protein (MYRIP), mRNA, RefSeq: NM_015460.1 n=1 Tax=Macaca fascicularis TaxID=9541 RepID=I7GP09_MACFA|nr:unnamed protein product [Macaca fascicularis]
MLCYVSSNRNDSFEISKSSAFCSVGVIQSKTKTNFKNTTKKDLTSK